MANIGIMEGAYFVGRGELLGWLNGLLGTNFAKIEETNTGVAHLLILDAIYPGKVPLSKVKFGGRLEWECINNFKILQLCFSKLAIDKVVDIQRLVKGKYQDNLEFLQWLKRYYELHSSGAEYNAEERVKAAGGSFQAILQSNTGKTPSPTNKPATKPAASTAPTTTASTTTTKPTIPAASLSSSQRRTSISTRSAITASPVKKPAATTTANKRVSLLPKDTLKAKENIPNQSAMQNNADAIKLNELKKQIIESKVKQEELEKEKDYFWDKLRGIEILCQDTPDDSSLTVAQFREEIKRILYATTFVGEERLSDDGMVTDDLNAQEIESF